MKKLFKNKKNILSILAIVIAILLGANFASATPQSTAHSMPYVVTATPVPVVTISASPTSGTVNTVHGILTWSATNSPTGCTASGDWTGAKPTSGSAVDQGVLTQVRTYTYTLTCSNAGGSSAPASATVVVNSAANQSPIVNAGLDQSLTQPQSSTSVTGTASDPDGTIASTVWSRVSGPSLAVIVSPNSLSTTITGLSTIGTYVFRLTATDNLGAASSDDMQITVGATPPSGTITTNVATCTVPLNGSTCSGVTATWTSSNTSSPNVWNGASQISTLANNTNFPVTVTYPSTSFTLRDGASTLSGPVTVTANCGANTWNGSACVAPIYSITSSAGAGGSIAPSGTTSVTSGGSQNYTFTPNSGYSVSAVIVDGSNVGSPSSYLFSNVTANHTITVSFSGSTPACSDGIDNDGDGLIDKNDPGCHVGNVLSGAYDPSDTTENNNPKIKVIEQ